MAKKAANDKSGSQIPGTREERQKALDEVIAQVEKQYGPGSLMRLGQNKTMNVDVIPTGSLSLDIALGVGGIPKGRIVEIYGPESSGKTTVALQMVAEAQKAGGEAAFIDVEHALDPTYAKALGVDIDSLLVSQPSTGEEALEITEALVRSNALSIGRHRLGRRDGHQSGDRRGHGRQPCRPAGPADEPGDAQADRHYRQDQLRRHLHQPDPRKDRRHVRQPRDHRPAAGR